MTIITAVAYESWGVITTDSYSENSGEHGGGTFINKVHTFPQWDMAMAMNGCPRVGELFRQGIGGNIREGLDDIEEQGRDMFRSAWEQVEADLESPATAQVVLCGWSQKRGTYAVVNIDSSLEYGFHIQIEGAGSGVFSPASFDFEWSQKGKTRKGFISELLRYSEQQYELYPTMVEETGFNAESPKAGGQIIATILQRGSIEQRIIGAHPNHRDLCEAIGARPAPIPDAVDPPVVLSQTTKPTPKAGRNDSCPCGSGRKFKRCCAG